MGLYDEVRCDYPLPKTGYELPAGHAGWQTKSLDPLMDLYVITAEGRLLREERELRWRDDPEYGLFGGYFETVERRLADTGFHGVLNFYDTFRLSEGKGLWAEFDAYYTRGTLEAIEVRDVHEFELRTKKVEVGDEEVEVHESGLGIDVMYLGEMPEVEREPDEGGPA